MNKQNIRPIAIYLPQFHPVPENDEWWGKGFTEWTNVAKARPLFKGHYQPQLPSDLGFYDLRVPEVREQQASLARENGIYGFCYYHYWFNGRRILERPFNEVLRSQRPDFPFMLCWANENWTKRWDGKNDEILLKQDYNPEDDRLHMEYLCRHVFSDPRYIRVDGKPVFIVYRTHHLPDPQETAAVWREVALKMGIGELYLCRMDLGTFPANPADLGFDASFHFQPDTFGFSEMKLNRIKKTLCRWHFLNDVRHRNKVYSYKDYIDHITNLPAVNYKRYPGVTPGWDNSSRVKEHATIFYDSNPELYKRWLKSVVDSFVPYSEEENFILMNAWNEWAEGNHLEPCRRWGNSYLEATRSVLIG